jgi:hypothetical protein
MQLSQKCKYWLGNKLLWQTYFLGNLEAKRIFPENTSLAPIYRPPMSKVFFRTIFR